MKELSSNTTPPDKTNRADKCGQQANKMATAPVTGMFIKMGLPMIISMVLQALYNVIDSIFVANMKADGALANQALSIAFPVQILMIAIGVGTGVGINACLSKSLGESEKIKVNKIAGNGIFLSFVIYAVFLIFGLFFAKPFVKLFTKNEQVIKMGTDYLAICCTLSLGSIGYTVYERFLQATGKTLFSTIAQILGAVTNIILDYVFIFPLNGGVEGAAWATVAGQFVSLFVAMAFHYLTNKEINGNVKYIKPEGKIIREIYKIGISAAIMQALLSVMTAGMNAVFDLAGENSDILIGAFGIYYKIQQIALFSAFGLSNTIITVLSFNYGLKDKQRIISCIKNRRHLFSRSHGDFNNYIRTRRKAFIKCFCSFGRFDKGTGSDMRKSSKNRFNRLYIYGIYGCGSRNSASLRIFGKAAYTVGTQACDIRFPDGGSFYTFKKSRRYRMVDFSDCRNFNGDILRNIFNRCDK